MSTAVFPSFVGLSWPITRAPRWSVGIKQSASGREFRTGYFAAPLYDYTLTFDYLSDADMRTMIGFFNARGGNFDSFYFLDQDDSTASAQTFGAGNGSATTFQLARLLGGFVEPVYAVASAVLSMDSGDGLGRAELSSASRTNLSTNSKTPTSWTPSGATWGSAVTAPDGTSTAATLIESATTAAHYIGGTMSYTAGSRYVRSVYAAPAGSGSTRYLAVDLPSTAFGTNYIAVFDLSAGVLLSVTDGASAGIAPAGNGYWRCWIAATATTSISAAPRFYIVQNASTPTASYAGDGVSGLKLWGRQTEITAGGPTRLITTTTTSASAAADYSISSTCLVTMASAPAAGAVLSWSGTFYQVVRFADSSAELEQFMSRLWSAKSIKLVTVRP